MRAEGVNDATSKPGARCRIDRLQLPAAHLFASLDDSDEDYDNDDDDDHAGGQAVSSRFLRFSFPPRCSF